MVLLWVKFNETGLEQVILWVTHMLESKTRKHDHQTEAKWKSCCWTRWMFTTGIQTMDFSFHSGQTGTV